MIVDIHGRPLTEAEVTERREQVRKILAELEEKYATASEHGKRIARSQLRKLAELGEPGCAALVRATLRRLA